MNRQRLKLKLPALSSAHFKKFTTILTESFCSDGIRVIEALSTIEKYDVFYSDYGEPQIEVHVMIRTNLSWRTAILTFVPKFLNKCSLKGLLDFNPTLQFADSGFFDDDCIPTHQDIGLSALHFGNMWRPCEFLSHFTRLDVPEMNEEVRQHRIELMYHLREVSTRYPMFVDFEHDRALLLARFVVLDGGYKDKTGRNRGLEPHIPASAYTVFVRYKSIRRILVDPTVAHSNSNIIRLYLHLNYPCEIRRFMRRPNARYLSDGERRRFFKENDQYRGSYRKFHLGINESPMICLQFTTDLKNEELYEILCRLRSRYKIPVEFASVTFGYFSPDKYADLPVRIIGCNYLSRPVHEVEPEVDPECSRKLCECKSFRLEYLIAALITRGAVVKDQILQRPEDRDNFINFILMKFNQDTEITLEVLGTMLSVVDEVLELAPLQWIYDKILGRIFGKKDLLTEIAERSERDGYLRVQKAIITPTRMLLCVPELIMGNRVLREFDSNGDLSLRIQFRDDDGALLRPTLGRYLVESTVYQAHLLGVHIGNCHFVYLASSNSQLRDHGCYFFNNGDGEEAKKIRAKLGKFDRTNIPKLMSRMGQCFTQSKECDVALKRSRYNETFDIIGGRDVNGKPYTFSDGVGKVSMEFAREISRDLGLGNSLPGCFQFRHRGLKGVLSVDPSLDLRSAWSKKHGIIDTGSKTNKMNDLDILFRPSQHKFNAPRAQMIEIVKYSSPISVCLNRPFINILDQVSEMQGYDVHTRVTERIHNLLDIFLNRLSEVLMSENKCRERLSEFPRRIGFDRLSLSRGFSLLMEPFFRTMILASTKYALQVQLMKEQIPVPPDLGRTMFGVVDETGLLQYGQLFIQYTNNIALKAPTSSAARTILKDKVLLTKNPSIVAGDVRVFDAVDIPQLHHLCDVVVFPQYGPRPHPDEMAGSDLDGDEYTIIWDPKFLFDYNMDAMEFAKTAREPQDIEEEEVVEEMRRFYVEYITQDSIGRIANSFLTNSDLYGITSKVCLKIAAKHSMSVDFPKTGESPEPLVKDWTIDPDTGESVPPERADRWPDFMNKFFEPSYVSKRLVGQIYRRIKLINDVLLSVTVSDQESKVELDKMLVYEGWKDYAKQAEINLSAYNACVLAILDNHGIEDEGQLFSGCFCEIRNRINGRDGDNMSLFNTEFVIEKKLTNIFRSFRREFFDEFGGFYQNTRLIEHVHGDTDTEEDRRTCTNPSDNMKKKASAYYLLAYSEPGKNTGGRSILSFPWVAWDILAEVRLENMSRCSERVHTSINPLSDSLSKFIDEYCSHNESEMKMVMSRLSEGESGLHAIKRYCRRHLGLDKLMFIFCKWFEIHNLHEDRLKFEHICLLLIQFGIGYLSGETYEMVKFLTLTDDIPYDDVAVTDLSTRLGGLGGCFMQFMRYLSSRAFQKQDMISFSQPQLGYHSILMRGQWLELHRAAVKSFFGILLTGGFGELTACNGIDQSRHTLSRLIELNPFTIDIPLDFTMRLDELRHKLLKHSGVTYLYVRPVTFIGRFFVSAVGTLCSLHKLQNLLAVEPTLKMQGFDQSSVTMMLKLVYERILSLP